MAVACDAGVTRPSLEDTGSVLLGGRTSKIISSRIPSEDLAQKWPNASPESLASSSAAAQLPVLVEASS